MNVLAIALNMFKVNNKDTGTTLIDVNDYCQPIEDNF